MSKALAIVGVCCALPIIILGAIWLIGANSQNLPPQGEQISIMGREHVPEGTRVATYNSNPPTSGPHWPQPAEWGAYSSPLPDEQLVHNLEHGGIWISYRGVDDATKEKLNTFAERYPQAVIVTPREENDTAIAVASWGRSLKLESYDEQLVEDFIQSNANRSPEPLALLGKEQVTKDKQAPEAAFITIDGRDRNISEFKGEKVMFWYLATWCPSCIAGAQVLAENNDKLGNLTIIALETYGNAGYPGPSMEAFARENAPQTLSAPNWLWGEASNEATRTYNPRNYPDIFFLIDEEGVVRDIDGAPAATIDKIIQFAN